LDILFGIKVMFLLYTLSTLIKVITALYEQQENIYCNPESVRFATGLHPGAMEPHKLQAKADIITETDIAHEILTRVNDG